MEIENRHLRAFDESGREPGESVLAWVEAEADGRAGAAILTDRRLCHCTAEAAIESVPVTGRVLRYHPRTDGDTLTAAFETEAGTIGFAVTGAEGEGRLGNLLGNLAELREAQARLEEAGIDPSFLSPPPQAGGEGVSAIYQLIRLKEMVNLGLLSDIEFALQRSAMIDRFRRQAGG